MKKRTAGFALTWDGARWPVTRLAPRARVFLAASLAPKKTMAAFRDGTLDEMRICWVPRLKGGTAVLCDPFATRDGKRISFRIEKTRKFGDVLGVIYRQR